jgi:hypothetical protein
MAKKVLAAGENWGVLRGKINANFTEVYDAAAAAQADFTLFVNNLQTRAAVQGVFPFPGVVIPGGTMQKVTIENIAQAYAGRPVQLGVIPGPLPVVYFYHCNPDEPGKIDIYFYNMSGISVTVPSNDWGYVIFITNNGGEGQ